MRLFRGTWAGACLLLALVGCTKDPDEVRGRGSYAPIITGITSSNEPAVRGLPNDLTAHVTNINNLTLTYHWLTAAGTLTDSTGETATWVPPDSIGTYDVILSVETTDPENQAYYFKSVTFHMTVDNQYTRWTHSETNQFDPAPIPGGGVLYSQIRSTATGSSDAYRVDTPLGGAVKLTSQFFSVVSPTPRADHAQFAFAGRKKVSDSTSIYLLSWDGGDTLNAELIVSRNLSTSQVGNPRFAHQGTWLLYSSDSLANGFMKIYRRDAGNFASSPVAVTDVSSLSQLFLNIFLGPNWGPDVNSDGLPDSVICTRQDFTGFQEGIYKISSEANTPTDVRFVPDAQAEEPDWSPNGQQIVFAKKNPLTDERDIWIISRSATSTTQAVRVTSGPADDFHPRFSADGLSIIFVSNRADRYGLNGVYGTERRGTNIWSVQHFDRP